MSAATGLLFNKLIYSMGWTVVHSLWQAGFVLALALMLTALFCRESAIWRYRVVLLAFFAIPLLSTATFRHYYQHYDETLYWLHQGFSLPQSVLQNEGLTAWVNRHTQSIVLLWVAGFLVGLVRYASALAYCHHLSSETHTQRAAELQTCVMALVRRMGMSKRVAARLSNKVRVPCVVGHIKPLILVPVALAAHIDVRQLEAILLHELAHIIRNDYLIGLFESFIKTLYFFNPFSHVLLKRIATERENICDDLTVAELGDAVLYARALESVGRSSAKGELAMAVVGSNQTLLARIKRQLEKGTLQQNNLGGFIAALALCLAALMFAVNAVGSEMPKVDYKGIESLNDEQVAELIILVRDAMEKHRASGKGVRDNTLDENPKFLQLSMAEKQVFMRYLNDELWRFFNMENWDLKLEGASQADLEETLRAMFAEHIGSWVQHLALPERETVYEYGGNGKTFLDFKRVPTNDFFQISINKEFIKILGAMPNGKIAYNLFSASYRENAGLQIEIPFEDIGTLTTDDKQRISWPLRQGEAPGPDLSRDEQRDLQKSYLVVDKWQHGIRVIISGTLLEHFEKGIAGRVGNGYLGMYETEYSYEIPLNPIEQSWIETVMVNTYSKYRTEDLVAPEDWRVLNERISRLAEDDKNLLPSEDDLLDFRTALDILYGFDMNDLSFEQTKYRYLENIVNGIEVNDRATRQMRTHRPNYSIGDSNIFVGMQNFLPLVPGDFSFDIDFRDAPFSKIYSNIQEQCPELNGEWSLVSSDEMATLVFKNLNCERVVSVLDYVEGVRSAGVSQKIIYN
ncbi:beta-lactamase regulating signal transducer with metallopeptidase domain [Alteromonadaceae bacterium 2753L.S.0a.02]|nr:beta-lactamase regulating signal transducer with metallopeptidase domain [Alteromonadaceae bacterium 2753L.S.0a.02]